MAPEVSSPATHRLPAAIGRYEILSLLGAGGMAQVYLALQRGAFSSEKLVVIKQLRPELVSDEVFLTMFMDEARIALQLHHPNVVHTYEVGTDGSAYFLAMEFLEGLTLTQIVRKAGVAGLPLSLHVWILTQVLAGLSYAHELRALDGEPMGIVHRDVSPSNVMITSSGEVKLLDFGIAKAAGALSFTQQGVIKGKLGYVAPEQCVGRASDSRADLFAVGVMLWEAIAGRRRVIAETSAAAFEARIRNHEPRIEDVAPNVPPQLAQICARALAHDPDERYATAAEFRADLEDFLDTNYSRVGASRLAAQMVQLFTDEFTALRLRIERYVQESRRPISSETPSTMQLDAADLSTFRPPAPRRGVLGPLLAAGIVVGAGLIWWVSRGQSPSSAAPPPPSPVVAVPGASVASVAAEPPAPAPSTVRVSVVAFPKSARLKLDGRPIDNPYSGQLPTDSLPHSLEARADGFGSVTHAVSFAGDVSMVLDLTREVGAPKASRAGTSYRPARAAEPAKTSARDDGTSSPLPTGPTRGADSPPVPGQDLRGLMRAPRPIDEKDLYQ